MANEQRKTMEKFNDGICYIYEKTDEETTLKYSGVRFADRVVGAKRYYAAAQVQVEINRLIRVQKGPVITPHDIVVINENGINVNYKIAQVQKIPDTYPPCIDISLSQLEMLLKFEE